jgi:hypothetical protein
MRQIRICAWIFISWSLLAACSGEEFSSREAPSAGGIFPGDTSTGAKNDDDDDDDSPAPAHAGSKATAGVGGNTASAGGSSGGASAGGSNPTPSGGQPGAEGGADSEPECPTGAITFRMLPGDDLPKDYLCDAGCGSGWLTITYAEGATAFSISSACGISSCESCAALPCAAAACLPTPLTAEGSELIWTGTYLAKDTCGQNLACQRQACVPPGKYKAKACAAVSGGSNTNGGGCLPKNTLVCAEAEFEFPQKKTIELVLSGK